MDKITHEVRLKQWNSIITECQKRSSDQTVKQWLAENDIHEKQYYYWLRRIRKEAYNELATQEKDINTSLVPAVNSEISFAEIAPDVKLSTTVIEQPSNPAATADVVIQTGNCTINISNSISPMLLHQILEVMIHA